MEPKYCALLKRRKQQLLQTTTFTNKNLQKGFDLMNFLKILKNKSLRHPNPWRKKRIHSWRVLSPVKPIYVRPFIGAEKLSHLHSRKLAWIPNMMVFGKGNSLKKLQFVGIYVRFLGCIAKWFLTKHFVFCQVTSLLPNPETGPLSRHPPPD